MDRQKVGWTKRGHLSDDVRWLVLDDEVTSYYATRKGGDRPWTLYDARGKVSASRTDVLVIDFPTLAELEDWIAQSDLP